MVVLAYCYPSLHSLEECSSLCGNFPFRPAIRLVIKRYPLCIAEAQVEAFARPSSFSEKCNTPARAVDHATA